MAAVDSVAEMTSLLEQWNREHPGGTSPVNVLHKMAELVERETEAYYKMDPDPFDDRHPGRANPTCAFGHVMKVLFKNEDFMNKLVSEYMLGNRDQTDIQTASSRLMLTVLPGVETSIVFQETEGLVRILLHWAETAPDPLRSYATGLLAGAMELKDVAANFKEANGRLVPLMLKRLHELRMQMEKEKSPQMHSSERPFVVFAKDEKNKIQEESSKFNLEEGQSPKKKEEHVNHVQETLLSCETNATPNRKAEKPDRHTLMKRALSPSYCREDFFKPKKARTADDSLDIEWSNSSWADMEPYVIGTFSLHPLTCAMKQRLILQYLTPMGEYQEHITIAMEHNAMELIFYYIDSKQNRDIRLSFEALKYLATLLCHKKFAVDFLQQSGVQKLLDVYRPSVAATGVSLCLYYVSYFEDVMERVCLLPDHVLSKMVSYVLWLLECSHDSSRFHAVIFFSQAFQFKVILNLFDHKDGFRRLLNMISTLRILNANDTDISDLSDDEIFTMRSAVRYVVMALKRYFEAHLMHKAHEIRRSHARNDGGAAVMETPDYKAIKLSPDVVQENIELMIELMPLRMHWKPETVLYNLGGLRLLSFIIASAPNWLNFNGKAETIIAALDILAVCTVCAFSQLQLLNSVDMGNDVKTPFMSVLIGLAEGDVISDPEIQKSALHVIINCVCGPLGKLGGFVGHFMSGISKKKNTARSGEGVLCSMWNGIRDNNGIMVLLKLLSIKMPITEADCIRALACKALWGMSRSETMRQIISKLPLFNNGELQRLMREPVLQDKRMEHVKFCKYASELLERVSGKNAQNSPWESSMDEIRRADIVAQTRIMYLEKDLLQLIHSHLQAKGLTEAAAALQKEADLPRSTTPPAIHPKNPHIFNSPQSLPTTPKFTRNPISSLTTSSNHSSPSLHTPGPASCLHHNGTVCTPSSQTDASSQSSGSSNTPGPGAGPLRFSLSRQHSQNTPTAIVSQPNKCRFFKEKMGHGHSPSLKNKIYKDKGADFDMTLDKLVTEYLRKQHALCRAPISTCPPMSLFEPHTCPLPRGKRCAPTNVLARSHYRSIHPRFGGINGASLDRKFIYSRFNHVKTFRDTEEDGFSCCSFLTKQNALLLGTYGGDIKVFGLSTSEEIETLAAHGAPLSQVIPTKDEKFLLTSFSGWGDMNGAGLWSYESDGLISKYTFDDKYVEFSHSEDQIIGTREEKANVYDTRTGELVVSLYDDAKANNYNLNRATFNPTDELVLNDGVLWDLRSKKAIHKFDKFNQNISGIFHPMGLEIIINSEVWDIRTFQLLHTVPSLDQCLLRFTSIGDVIYAIHLDPEFDLSEERMKSPYETTFRTMDATDYSPIVTYDLKCRSISCISADSADSYLAVVENSQFSEASSDDCSCKLYEIGKLREDDDTQGDDEEEEDLNPDDEDDVLNLDSNDDDDDDDDIDDDDDDENPLNESNLDSDDNEPISISDEDGVDDEDGWEDVDVDDEDDDVDDILFQLV